MERGGLSGTLWDGNTLELVSPSGLEPPTYGLGSCRFRLEPPLLGVTLGQIAAVDARLGSLIATWLPLSDDDRDALLRIARALSGGPADDGADL